MKIFLILLVLGILIKDIYTRQASESGESIESNESNESSNSGTSSESNESSQSNSGSNETPDAVTINWITQKLDHFDDSNSNTWNMRYLSDLSFFKPQKPILIFVGAEWNATSPPTFVDSGHLHDIAQELNGAIFGTEHRFYGDSKPTQDISLDNLKYIHTNQSLADLAHFIKTLKLNPAMKDSKVVVASGSYGGAMVTWFRKIYPELTVGGWASSAPLNAQVDFKDYNELAGESVRLVCGDNGYNRIENGIKKLEKLFDEDINQFKEKLMIDCGYYDPNNKLDMYYLFNIVANLFTNIVLSNNKQGIQNNICDPIMNFNGDDGDAVINFYTNIMQQQTCTDVLYQSNINYLKVTDWNYWGSDTTRIWTYQLCTEFGYFHSSASNNQPFGSRYPVDLFINQCNDVFGINNSSLYNNIQYTNDVYGGFSPDVTNVYWSNGGLDPWRGNALLKHADGSNNIIPWYSHFQDFYSISSKDTQQMQQSKINVRNLIKQWVGVSS